jgi:hypothetical protein
MLQLQQQVKGQVKIQSAPHDQHLNALEAAIKSIRKTGEYGYSGNGKFTFEWPKVYNLRYMVKNMPTKITDFRHARST